MSDFFADITGERINDVSIMTHYQPNIKCAVCDADPCKCSSKAVNTAYQDYVEAAREDDILRMDEARRRLWALEELDRKQKLAEHALVIAEKRARIDSTPVEADPVSKPTKSLEEHWVETFPDDPVTKVPESSPRRIHLKPPAFSTQLETWIHKILTRWFPPKTRWTRDGRLLINYVP